MQETPARFRPNQYANPGNPLAHEQSTGPEIWRQTGGRITHFVAGVGTGGTITGVGRYLKSQNPDIQIVAADPEGSVYSGGSGRPYLVEGIGEDFWPATYDPSLVDEVIPISDEDSFLTARRVTREEGILIGGSRRAGGRRRARVGACRARATSSSCSSPTRVVATCRGSSTTSGWPASGSSAASGPTRRRRAREHARRRSPSAACYVHPDDTVRRRDRS